jgi:hypothetical protein
VVPELDLKKEIKSKFQEVGSINTCEDKLDLNKDYEPGRFVFEIEELVLELEIGEEKGASWIVKQNAERSQNDIHVMFFG